jgi:diacylglycerol kinase (ATP)
MSASKALVIVNPVAGGGRAGRLWPAMACRLRRLGFPFDHCLTEERRHAIELARNGVKKGYDLVVAVGGDGTVNEVVNGLVDGGERAGVPLGVIAAGRGSDFNRTLGIPVDCEQACRRLAAASSAESLEGITKTVDLGLLSFQSAGRPERRYFVNVAGSGFDGEVAARANVVPRFMGGTIPYLTALVTTLLMYQNRDVEMVLDGGQPRHLRANSVIVANCQYFAGGMHIAPMADPTDGILDVVVLGDIGRLEFLQATPTVYSGKHVTHPKIEMHRARRVEIRSSQPMRLQADGEVLGAPPFIFEVLPGALSVLV